MNRVETIGGADSSLSVFKWLSKRVVKRVAALRFENNHRIHIYMYIGVGIFRKEGVI